MTTSSSDASYNVFLQHFSIFFILSSPLPPLLFLFFLNDPAPTEISPLSLHDALPIPPERRTPPRPGSRRASSASRWRDAGSPARSTRAPRSRSALRPRPSAPCCAPPPARPMRRSEEHTSELQSRLHLVCRLLLEKKKQ